MTGCQKLGQMGTAATAKSSMQLQGGRKYVQYLGTAKSPMQQPEIPWISDFLNRFVYTFEDPRVKEQSESGLPVILKYEDFIFAYYLLRPSFLVLTDLIYFILFYSILFYSLFFLPIYLSIPVPSCTVRSSSVQCQ
jgi:hypothetical protein